MNDPNRFDPGSIGTFRVVDRMFDRDSRTVSLHYSLDDEHDFVETITFETPPAAGADPNLSGLGRALLHLHIAAGTSYYKAAAPPVVVVEHEGLVAAELEFHRHLYDEGLREFAVANGLPVPSPVAIRPGDTRARPSPPTRFERPGGILVPIGGGKDSMVLIEALSHLRPRLFAVNPHPLVIDLAEQTGLELLVVRRQLSPLLGELNRSGAFNGHVPITAIISLIAVVGSFLYGYDTIVMAVERSASEETVMVDGVPVNHQYSKSLEFEFLARNLISDSIDPGLTYGSALRPYSELAIARAFARLTKYHATFCSCNTVFRQTATAQDGWCGNCPKCRFVGLMLAPFVEPDALTAIIGRDMFADLGQVPGFEALMSNEDKPFECVGERRESAAAIRILSQLPQWRDTVVVTALSSRARGMVSDAEVAILLTAQPSLAFPRADVSAAVDRVLTEVP
jgi:UDP-N-acetyl-alpha-D-muramoyl-L-alanyl-L-glutamate epimerase